MSKVVFYLHESFAQAVSAPFQSKYAAPDLRLCWPILQVRTVSEPPFEVTENGWGEFDTRIRIYFRDSSEESLEILHPLKLYPPNGAPPSAKKPVVSEFYDEVCFTNPSEEFYGMMARDAQKACVESSLQVCSQARSTERQDALTGVCFPGTLHRVLRGAGLAVTHRRPGPRQR